MIFADLCGIKSFFSDIQRGSKQYLLARRKGRAIFLPFFRLFVETGFGRLFGRGRTTAYRSSRFRIGWGIWVFLLRRAFTPNLDYSSKLSSVQAMVSGMPLPEAGDFVSRWEQTGWLLGRAQKKKNPVTRMVTGFFDGGQGGIRTHEPVRTT